MKNKLLIVLNYFVFLSINQCNFCSDADVFANVNPLRNAPIKRSVSPVSVVDRSFSPIDQSFQDVNPIRNAPIKRSVSPVSVVGRGFSPIDQSFQEVNPIRKLQVIRPSLDKKLVSRQYNNTDLQNSTLKEILKNQDGGTTELVTDSNSKKVLSRVTRDGQGNVVESFDHQKQVTPKVTRKQQPKKPIAQARQSVNNGVMPSSAELSNMYAPESYDGNAITYSQPRVEFANVYAPETYGSNVVEYTDNPMRQPVKKAGEAEVNFADVYNPSIIESANNSMRSQVAQPAEAQINFAGIYTQNEGLGSALHEFTSHNPTQQNRATDLVVYDPEQKFQKTLDFSQASVLPQATKAQIAQGSFINEGSTIQNALRLSQQNQAVNNGDQSISIDQAPKKSDSVMANDLFSGTPAQQNRATDLVVYDPEQKFQKTLDLSQASVLPQATKAQIAQRSFINGGSAIQNALRLSQQNQAVNNGDQSISIDQAPKKSDSVMANYLFSGTPASSNSSLTQQQRGDIAKIQTDMALNSQAKIAQNVQAQKNAKQAEAVQKALQSKKPSSVRME